MAGFCWVFFIIIFIIFFRDLNKQEWGKTEYQTTTARTIPPIISAIVTDYCQWTHQSYLHWGWCNRHSRVWRSQISLKANWTWGTSSVYKSHSLRKSMWSQCTKAKTNPTRNCNFLSFQKMRRSPKSMILNYFSNLIDFLVATINIEEERLHRVRE